MKDRGNDIEVSISNQLRHLEEARLLSSLEETVFPSLGSIELQRDPLRDFQYRFMAKSVNIAELFHENSKIRRSSRVSTFTNPQLLETVKEWFFSTAYKISEDDIKTAKAKRFRINLKDLPSKVANIIRSFTGKNEGTDFLFALDINLLYENRLYRYTPGDAMLWLEKIAPKEQIKRVSKALPSKEDNFFSNALATIFLVACPWRYMIFSGPRGYRNTLIDSGILINVLKERADAQGLKVKIWREFYDYEIDSFLKIDGVEKSTCAILSVWKGKK